MSFAHFYEALLVTSITMENVHKMYMCCVQTKCCLLKFPILCNDSQIMDGYRTSKCTSFINNHSSLSYWLCRAEIPQFYPFFYEIALLGNKGLTVPHQRVNCNFYYRIFVDTNVCNKISTGCSTWYPTFCISFVKTLIHAENTGRQVKSQWNSGVTYWFL